MTDDIKNAIKGDIFLCGIEKCSPTGKRLLFDFLRVLNSLENPNEKHKESRTKNDN